MKDEKSMTAEEARMALSLALTKVGATGPELAEMTRAARAAAKRASRDAARARRTR